MKKITLIILISCHMAMGSISFAQEKDSLQNIVKNKSWDRFSVSLGGFIALTNTSIRLGSKQLGIGIDIDLEDALGMEVSNFVFRGDAIYRIGERKRHSVKVNYFSFTRSAYKVLEAELEIGDHIFPIGSEIDSRFDLSILNIAYDYSFFSDERINLGASIGFFIMPTKFELGIAGSRDEAASFIGILPVFGFRSDFAITKKLYIKENVELLYMRLSGYTGSILDVNIRLEHNTWKNFGFGIGLNMYKLKIKSEADGYLGLNFVGNIEMGYAGILFFAKYYF